MKVKDLRRIVRRQLHEAKTPRVKPYWVATPPKQYGFDAIEVWADDTDEAGRIAAKQFSDELGQRVDPLTIDVKPGRIRAEGENLPPIELQYKIGNSPKFREAVRNVSDAVRTRADEIIKDAFDDFIRSVDLGSHLTEDEQNWIMERLEDEFNRDVKEEL